jgi:hypothetical protein
VQSLYHRQQGTFMIVDASKLVDAVDAVTEPAVSVDLPALERHLQVLSPAERENLREALTNQGRAVLALNGKPLTLQVRYRPERRG